MMLDLQTYSFPHFPRLLDQCPTTGDWGIELGGQRLVLMKDVQSWRSNWAWELVRAGLRPETLPNHIDSREMPAMRP